MLRCSLPHIYTNKKFERTTSHNTLYPTFESLCTPLKEDFYCSKAILENAPTHQIITSQNPKPQCISLKHTLLFVIISFGEYEIIYTMVKICGSECTLAEKWK